MTRSGDITLAGDRASPPQCPNCGAESAGQPFCTVCGGELRDPRVGTVIAGRYRIDYLLAEGGMGRVYRATHLALGEPCVVKFLIEVAGRGDLRARFRREATLLARLGHPNAVAVMDFGEDGEQHYLVLELVRGVPLSTQIGGDCAPLPLMRLGTIFGQLLEVLEAAHGMGIVHRDLKPDNVMLLDAGDRLDRIKLLDFGLALVPTAPDDMRLTQAGAIVGTPAYMAPEQCRGEEIGPPADIYSVGVMLYEALAGKTPFNEVNPAAMMARHLYAPPPPIPSDRGWPPALAKLVLRMLTKDAAKRPTASEAHDELVAIASGVDPETRATAERIVRASADRATRAIGTSGVSVPKEKTPSGARVLVCCRDQARFEELAMALGVNGLVAVPWLGDASPAARIAEGDLAGALVEYREGWDLRLGGALPVVAFDVRDTQQLAAAIRGGVADAAMERTTDGEIGFRVKRVIAAATRGRR